MKDESPDITEALQRRLVFDMMPCSSSQGAINTLGLNPSSPEGAKIEHMASHARMDKLAPVIGPIHVYAALIAEIWMKVFLASVPEGSVPEEMKPQIYATQMEKIIEASSAIIANMLDSGMLAYGDGITKKDENDAV